MKALTVCIPTYNSSKFLTNLLHDLENQTFRDFIVYFADGGSTDNTLKLICSSNLNYRLISKKDSRIEEGINNCLLEINTKYFCIIGSDDRIPYNFFEKLFWTAEKRDVDFTFPAFAVEGAVQNCEESFTKLKYKMIPPGIGWVARASVLEQLSGFSLKYSVASDYEFLCRANRLGMNFHRVNDVAYQFSLGGNSDINKFKGFREVRDISIENGCNWMIAYGYYFLKFFFYKFNQPKG